MLNRISLNHKHLRQFVSYVFVGGAATVVEWGLFWLLCVYPLKWNQNLGFTAAFIFSTFANMVLGRIFTFKNAKVIRQSDNNKLNVLKETSLIYLIAVVGYMFNLLLLNLFTGAFHFHMMAAKMLATGIVFFWNYLARKLGVYRDAPPAGSSSR